MVMLDVVGLDVGFLAGLLGIIGSSLAVCNCFQGMDLRSIVKVRQRAYCGKLHCSASAAKLALSQPATIIA